MAQDSLGMLDERLKKVIQTLYTVQLCAHGYAGPETQQELIRSISALGPQINAITQFPPGSLPAVPPEMVGEYIDQGRNPDIYNRDFVEIVLRSNAYLKGKADAYAEFRDVLADEIVRGIGEEMQPLVDKAVRKATSSTATKSEGGTTNGR